MEEIPEANFIAIEFKSSLSLSSGSLPIARRPGYHLRVEDVWVMHIGRTFPAPDSSAASSLKETWILCFQGMARRGHPLDMPALAPLSFCTGIMNAEGCHRKAVRRIGKTCCIPSGLTAPRRRAAGAVLVTAACRTAQAVIQ
jgi:hypothetical protein